MSKRIAIVQSSYIPWKGYFDLIDSVDEFVLYDSVQFTRRDWRNRNRIKTPHGIKWLTIPVISKGKYNCSINEIRVADGNWARQHWATIQHVYAKSEFFSKYSGTFRDLYLNNDHEFLSQINHRFIAKISEILGITTRLSIHSDDADTLEKNKRLINICRDRKATEYVSGPSASTYLDNELFETAGLKLSYMDYSNYPEYNQLYGEFDHNVSVIDLIFNVGPKAPDFVKIARQGLR